MVNPIPCQAGFYREEGIRPINCIACPEGTYNPESAATTPDACQPCPAGIVCTKPGISIIDETNSYDCPAKYVCFTGTSRSTRFDVPCPIGAFCYSGTPSIEEAKKNKCPAGRFCKAGSGALEGDVEIC